MLRSGGHGAEQPERLPRGRAFFQDQPHEHPRVQPEPALFGVNEGQPRGEPALVHAVFHFCEGGGVCVESAAPVHGVQAIHVQPFQRGEEVAVPPQHRAVFVGVRKTGAVPEAVGVHTEKEGGKIVGIGALSLRNAAYLFEYFGEVFPIGGQAPARKSPPLFRYRKGRLLRDELSPQCKRPAPAQPRLVVRAAEPCVIHCRALLFSKGSRIKIYCQAYLRAVCAGKKRLPFCPRMW